MKEYKIEYPGYMERSVGFSIPENGIFYMVSREDLVYYELETDKVVEIEDEWEIDTDNCIIHLNGEKIPFIGLFGGTPILEKQGIGKLELKNSTIKLIKEEGSTELWNLENFSGDWEQVTFDKYQDALLFGAPYDFDYRYIKII
ncbi:hypothetical protein [Aquimarina sp. Aq78]|uniref:hypothetical protein n=1 Tax=Aquimarina sp. Aq78 TaxID=1191889 RepID=UPI000D101456|nr:hypothetical protein [Aquimarina sp. Aq78]